MPTIIHVTKHTKNIRDANKMKILSGFLEVLPVNM